MFPSYEGVTSRSFVWAHLEDTVCDGVIDELDHGRLAGLEGLENRQGGVLAEGVLQGGRIVVQRGEHGIDLRLQPGCRRGGTGDEPLRRVVEVLLASGDALRDLRDLGLE